MNLSKMVNLYVNNGYKIADALAKVSQDIILLKISRSTLNKNITVKGGVVMHSISNDKRRATRDIDFDFIKYSLDDSSIIAFIDNLNQINDGIKIQIKNKIQELSHQDYNGKRVYIELTDDFDYIIASKLDIGVHKNFDIEQEEYCFDLDIIKESATLLINSKEQIFTEKLKSLLRFGYTSTRYKDVFDFYYLIYYASMDKNKIERCVSKMIFNDKTLNVKDFESIYIKLNNIFKNKRFSLNLNNLKVNWLEISNDDVTKNILDYIESFEKVST